MNLFQTDMKQREYVLGDGSTVPFGRGNKQVATLKAIELADPILFGLAQRLAEKHEVIASRVWKACGYIVEGWAKVLEDEGQTVAMVMGGDKFGAYNVTDLDGVLGCDCTGFMDGFAPIIGNGLQPYCTHILAYRLMLATEARKQSKAKYRFGDDSPCPQALEGEYVQFCMKHQGRRPLNQQNLMGWIYRN